MGWLALSAVLLASWKSPYPPADEKANVLYTSFTEEPRHLDPARAYPS